MRPDGFLADLERMPATLAGLAGRLRREDPWAEVPWNAGDRVLLLGMGSSTYAAQAAALRLRTAGVTATAELASAAAEGHGWPPAPDLLVVAVSAGGSSVETLAAAGRYAGAGRLVALTEQPGSELARMADLVVPLGSGPEGGGVACRSYRHTVVLLEALVGRLSGATSVERLAGATERGADAIRGLLAGRDGWLPGLADRLDSPDGVYVLAPAARLAAARQSALMLREGPRRAAVACETGDWAHVDVYLARTLDYRVLLLPGSRWDAHAMEWLTLRGSTVVPVGDPVDGALPPVPVGLPPDGDRFLERMLVEPTVAELLAQHWWSAQPPG
jgi:glutamine---fructose-6-phosphate transaminase (isomerizing)